MILQALVGCYEDLVAKGKNISPPGWAPMDVSYALCLREDGTVFQLASLKHLNNSGKKTIMAPLEAEVPEQPNRHGKVILPGFLAGNAKYMLGYDPADPERGKAYFDSERELHLTLLADVDTTAAHAVRTFFSTWVPEQAAASPLLADALEDLGKGANLVFQVGLDLYAHDDPAIRAAWERYYEQDEPEKRGICLVTGESAPIATIHPLIKGLPNGQPSGVSLVSFNAKSLESYGKIQGANAPTSRYAACAYAKALNYLLKEKEHHRTVGSTTYVFWAEGGDDIYGRIIDPLLSGSIREKNEGELAKLLTSFSKGEPLSLNGMDLDADKHIYILGLSPNAARASVRFFWCDTFGTFIHNINSHYRRMLLGPGDDVPIYIGAPKYIIEEAANRGGKKNEISSYLSGALYRAVINNMPYPSSLVQLIYNRIRADGQVTPRRISFLKASLVFGKEEKGNMATYDPTCKDIAYVMGALFAVYERIQQEANPNINATIRDRYFCLAQDAPQAAFHQLNRLATIQLKQAWRRNPRKAAALDDGVKKLMEQIDVESPDDLAHLIPCRFSFVQKNLFIVGYYHCKPWAKKAKEPSGTNTDTTSQNQEGE